MLLFACLFLEHNTNVLNAGIFWKQIWFLLILPWRIHQRGFDTSANINYLSIVLFIQETLFANFNNNGFIFVKKSISNTSTLFFFNFSIFNSNPTLYFHLRFPFVVLPFIFWISANLKQISLSLSQFFFSLIIIHFRKMKKMALEDIKTETWPCLFLLGDQ